MSGPCKQRVVAIDCDGNETCVMGYVTDMQIAKDAEHPYELESLKARLPFALYSMQAKSIRIDESVYDVMAVAGYPSGDRAILTLARPVMSCQPSRMMVYTTSLEGGCEPGMEGELFDRIVGYPVHMESEVDVAYDSRGTNETWRVYLSREDCQDLTTSHYFEHEGKRLSIQRIVGKDTKGAMPYAVCEVNRWGLST